MLPRPGVVSCAPSRPETNVASLAPLYPAKKLTDLYAEKTMLKNLAGIQDGLPNLELLWIFDTSIKDLTTLTGMDKLSELIPTRLKGLGGR